MFFCLFSQVNRNQGATQHNAACNTSTEEADELEGYDQDDQDEDDEDFWSEYMNTSGFAVSDSNTAPVKDPSNTASAVEDAALLDILEDPEYSSCIPVYWPAADFQPKPEGSGQVQQQAQELGTECSLFDHFGPAGPECDDSELVYVDCLTTCPAQTSFTPIQQVSLAGRPASVK